MCSFNASPVPSPSQERPGYIASWVAAAWATIAAGMGAALLPRLSVDPGHPGVRVVELDIGLPPRLIGLAWHRDRDLLPAAREFVATTECVCAQLAAEQPVGEHA